MQPLSSALYFAAHVLPPHLDAQVLDLKKNLHRLYGCAVGLKSPAHITLVPPFWLAAGLESALLQDAQRLAQQTNIFEIATAHFSSFGKRTLFIAVAPNESLNKLKTAADAVFAASGKYGVKKETRPFHPHITLATRDLKPAHFDAAWAFFKNKSFEATWSAGHISVLRHNGACWEVIATESFIQG